MRKRNGFTLIELLIVVAILAILLTLLVPALGRAKEQAKAARCLAHLHQWGTIFSMYTTENRDRFMKGLVTDSDPGSWMGKYTWCNVLRPYYSDKKEMRICPNASKTQSEGGLLPWAAWAIWERDDADTFTYIKEDMGSYGINWWVGDCGTDQHGGVYKGEDHWRRVESSCMVDRIPVFMDCGFILARPRDTNPPPEFDGDFSWDENKGMHRVCHNRHQGGINMLFMDWHAERVKLIDLWRFKWHRRFDTSVDYEWPQWMQELY